MIKMVSRTMCQYPNLILKLYERFSIKINSLINYESQCL